MVGLQRPGPHPDGPLPGRALRGPSGSGGVNTRLDALLLGTSWEHQLGQITPLLVSNENVADVSYRVITALKDEGRDELVLWTNVQPPPPPGQTQLPARRWGLARMQWPAGVNIRWEHLEVISASGVIAAIGNPGPTAAPGEGRALLLVPVFDNYFVDRDDALQPWDKRKPLRVGQPIYSGPDRGKPDGSTEAGWTGDLLLWKANLPDDIKAMVNAYQWEARRQPDVAGDEEEIVARYSGGLEASEWRYDATKPLNWKPGRYKVRVTFTLTGGAQGYAEYDQEVGVRAKDVVVVGWIDKENVPLDPTGVNSEVLIYFPQSGIISNLAQTIRTGAYLYQISLGRTTRPGLSSVVPPSLNSSEKIYILNWMFKYAPNNPPPRSFSDDNALDSYRKTRTNYKLYNRLEIKYLVSGSQFSTGPQRLRQDKDVGVTIDPILGRKLEGRTGPADGRTRITGNDTYHHINDGTPEARAVSAFNVLMDPLKWNNIGSKLAQGVPLLAEGNTKNQMYPTYWIYNRFRDGGFYLIEEPRPQAPNPSDNFTPESSSYSNEHPTGSAPYILPP